MATPPLFISYARGSCECLPDCHSVALCVGCFRIYPAPPVPHSILFCYFFKLFYYFLHPLGGVECHLGSVSPTHTPPFNVCFSLLLSVSVSSTGVVSLRGACHSSIAWRIGPPQGGHTGVPAF